MRSRSSRPRWAGDDRAVDPSCATAGSASGSPRSRRRRSRCSASSSGVVATVWMLSLVPVLEPVLRCRRCHPGPGQLPFGGWTLFTLIQGTPLIWVLWLAGLLGAVALTVGFRTRLAALIVFVVIMSVTRSAPLAFNAGRRADAARRLLPAPHAGGLRGVGGPVARRPASTCGASPGAHRGPCASRRSSSASSTSPPCGRRRAVRSWRDGTAVSYAVRIGEVSRVPVPSFVTDSLLLTQLATYGTLAAELAVGILVWNRAARPWVLALGVLLHLSIELTLAVGFFSLTIVTLYLAFLPPDRAERVLRWGRDRWRPASTSARESVAGDRRWSRTPRRQNCRCPRPGGPRTCRPRCRQHARASPTGSGRGRPASHRATEPRRCPAPELTLSSRCDG